MATFVKYGSETLLGFASRRVHQLARQAGENVSAMPVKLLVTASVHAEMRAEVLEVFDQLCTDLVKSHKEFKRQERRAEKDKLLNGSVSEQKQAELDNAKRLFEKLSSAVTGLSEALGRDPPELEEDKDDEDAGKGSFTVFSFGAEALGSLDYGPYGDAESRAFYEDLPDLLATVPLAALGLTPEQAAAMREEWRVAKEKAQQGDGEVAVEGEGEGEVVEEAEAEPAAEEVVEKEKEKEGTSGKEGEAEEGTPHARVLLLVEERLPECVNRQKCDEFCTSFCYLNNKGARKRLVQALVKIPRSRLDLTITYSR